MIAVGGGIALVGLGGLLLWNSVDVIRQGARASDETFAVWLSLVFMGGGAILILRGLG